jgi:predicted CoA-binding protein
MVDHKLAPSAKQFIQTMPTVAILGASADRSKFGNKAVRAFRARGYTVYPVNPKGGDVEGLPVYISLAKIPLDFKLDWISVYLPPTVGLKVLPEIAARGCGELWLNPGSESDELVTAARKLGLEPIQACSIVAIGMSPHDFP